MHLLLLVLLQFWHRGSLCELVRSLLPIEQARYLLDSVSFGLDEEEVSERNEEDLDDDVYEVVFPRWLLGLLCFVSKSKETHQSQRGQQG